MATLLTPRWYETCLFLALQSGPPRFRQRDAIDSLALQIDWAVMLNAAVLMLGALWVFVRLNEQLLTEKSLPRLGTTQNLALLLASSLFVSSSLSPSPMLSLYKTLQMFMLLLFSFLWLRRFGIDSTLKHIFCGYFLLTLALIGCGFFAPDLVIKGAAHRLRGDQIGEAGQIAIAGLIITLCYPVSANRIVIRTALLSSSICLVWTQSRTTYIAAGLFFLLAAVTQPHIPRLRHAIRFLLVFLPCVILIGLLPLISGWVVREAETVSDMNDRIPLWTHLLTQVMSTSPWMGVGIYGYRADALEYNKALGSAHSAFIEMLCAGGLVGGTVFFVLFLILVASVVRLYLLDRKSPLVFLVVSLFIAACCAGVTGEEMVVEAPTNFLFWTLVSLIPRVTQIVQVGRRFAFTKDRQGFSSVPPLTVQKG